VKNGNESRPISGYLLIIGAAVLWGTTGTSQALAPAGVTPLSIGAMRLLLGSLALLALALSQGGFRRRTGWDIRAVLIAGSAIAAYQVTFFAGVKLASIAIGTIVGIGSAPIFGALLGHFYEHEKLERRWFLATALSLSGVVLLGAAGKQSLDLDPRGVLLALAAGLTYAVYTLYNKRLLATHDPDEVMAVTFGLGALLLLPFIFTSPMQWLASPRGMLVAGHLGLIATGLSYALFGRGLKSVPVSTTTTLTLAEPLTAGLLGVLVVGERLPPVALIGIALIAAGLLMLTVFRPAGQTRDTAPGG